MPELTGGGSDGLVGLTQMLPLTGETLGEGVLAQDRDGQGRTPQHTTGLHHAQEILLRLNSEDVVGVTLSLEPGQAGALF